MLERKWFNFERQSTDRIEYKYILRNARLLQEYLGCYEDDVNDVVGPQVLPPYVKGAGPAAAIYTIGPYLTPMLHRLRNGHETVKEEGQETEKIMFTSIFGLQLCLFN